MKPYYNHAGIKIYHGHTLEVLKSMEAESVQMCITSPPYWGLRDYNLPPMIWDGDENCEHVWGNHQIGRVTGGGDRPPDNKWKKVASDGNYDSKSIRSFCLKCGAWRGSLGLEPTPELYVNHLVQIFSEVKRVLRKDGTFWLVIGDSYMGSGIPDRNDLPAKNLCGVPWRVAFALQADDWYLRQDIIWKKGNPMPESVKDRCTRSHEYIFMLTKSAKYYYDHVSIMEDAKDKESYKGRRRRNPKTILTSGCRIGNPQSLDKGNKTDGKIYKKVNKRSVWEINTKPCKEAHFAVFPPEIPEICILAGTSEKDCCPKCGNPRERIIQKPDMAQRPTRAKESKMNTNIVHISNNWQGVPKSAGQKYQNWRNANPDKTIGWRPTCKCGIKETIPCVILDPFLGSGTSTLVAHKLGRRSVGIELSESYLKDIAIPKIEKETKQLKMF